VETETFCTHCNHKIDKDTEICPECGKEIKIPENKEHETIYCSNCGAETTAESEYCSECGEPVHREIGEDAVAMDATEKGKKVPPSGFRIKPLYISIIAIVILATAFGFKIMANSLGDINSIVYAKDKELYYTNLCKLKPFEMTSKLSYAHDYYDYYDYINMSRYVLTSEDGRYIFYPDKVDDDGFIYYWRDLKTDNSKNDAAVKIDSEIMEAPFISSDGGKFFYIKDDGDRFYVFDRKSGEKNKLDEDVFKFYVNEKGDYVIYSKYVDGEYIAYEISLKGISGEKNKIDSDINICGTFIDEKRVYYSKDEVLYLKEFGKERVKISSDVNKVVSIVDGKSVYYLKTDEVTNKLSALVNDDLFTIDRDLTEPVEPQTDPKPEHPLERDYQNRIWKPNYWGLEYNYSTREYGHWVKETDYEAYNAACDKYEKEYSEWEDKYGEIVDKYEEEYDRYQGKGKREELRTALDDEDNAITYDVYSLYYWNNGVEVLVASDLARGSGYGYCLASSSDKPLVVYQKYSEDTDGSHKMSEIIDDWGNHFYVYDVIKSLKNKLATTRKISEEIYVASGNKESIIKANDPAKWGIKDGETIYFLENYDSEKNYGTLMSSSIKGGVAEKQVKVDDEVNEFFFGNENGNCYYFKDIRNDSGDLYLNGKTIATDVFVDFLYSYKGTDTLVYYTDYSDKNDKGTLCILKKGKEIKIDDDVSFFVPVNEKTIAYLVDYNFSRERGDLRLYNGNNKTTPVDSDVTALLWDLRMMWEKSY